MFRIARSPRCAALVVVALSLVVSGCSGKGKPSKDNFEKVKEGMSAKEVESLMGPPTKSNDVLGVIVKEWMEGDTGYVVMIQGDKVKQKKSGKKDEMDKGAPPKQGGDKVTKENAAKLKNEMTKAEVEAILGPPTRIKADDKNKDIESATWGDSVPQISITYDKGKVVAITKIGL